MVSTYEVSEEDWTSGVNELGTQQGIFFRIRWSFGIGVGIVHQLRVNNRKIQIFLRQSTPQDSLTTLLQLSLPDQGFGYYEKRTDTAGSKELVLFSLRILMEPGNLDADVAGEIYVTNGLGFLLGEGMSELLQ